MLANYKQRRAEGGIPSRTFNFTVNGNTARKKFMFIVNIHSENGYKKLFPKKYGTKEDKRQCGREQPGGGITQLHFYDKDKHWSQQQHWS